MFLLSFAFFVAASSSMLVIGWLLQQIFDAMSGGRQADPGIYGIVAVLAAVELARIAASWAGVVRSLYWEQLRGLLRRAEAKGIRALDVVPLFETVGDLDVLVDSAEPGEVMDRFAAFPGVATVIARGHARQQRIDGSVEPDHDRGPGHRDTAAVGLDHPAGGRHHRRLIGRQGVEQHLLLQLVEVVDAVPGSDLGPGSPLPSLQVRVAVTERSLQPLGDGEARRRLARPHHADEHDVPVDAAAHPRHERTACPPNCWRSAAITRIASGSSCREANRANRAAVITGAGVAVAIASSTVQRPSPESSA
jgi:hypothetical protein